MKDIVTTGHLYVEMNRSANIPLEVGDSPACGAAAPYKYLEVALQYMPSCDKTASTLEAFDRDWFKTLVDLNPSIDNLGEAVKAAAKALISQVHPAQVDMLVSLSNDVDKLGFCSKTVKFSWSKESKENN
jgi:hypothetical protein